MSDHIQRSGEPFAQISESVLTACHGQPSAYMVYGTLWMFADWTDRSAYPSIGTIAKRCGLSGNTVRAAIAHLESVGLLVKTVRKTATGNLSHLYMLATSPKGVLQNLQRGTSKFEGGVLQNLNPNNNQLNNNHEQEYTGGLFDWLKSNYPKRAGDHRWKAVLLRLSKLPTSEHEALKRGVLNYKAWCDATGKTGTETVKQAATFVNGECWKEYQQPVEVVKQRDIVSARTGVSNLHEISKRVLS